MVDDGSLQRIFDSYYSNVSESITKPVVFYCLYILWPLVNQFYNWNVAVISNCDSNGIYFDDVERKLLDMSA